MKSKGSALQIVVILWSIFISFFMIFMSSNGYRYQLLHNIDNVMKQKNIEIFLTKYYIETMKEDFLLSDTFTGENYEIEYYIEDMLSYYIIKTYVNFDNVSYGFVCEINTDDYKMTSFRYM